MNDASLAIELHGVSKTFDADARPIEALKNVSLKIHRGEHVAIMGPSGSGKSTLLSILGCLDKPDAGSCRYFGSDVGTLSPTELAAFRNQSIGFVFQNLSLLPRMTVLENVALPFEYSSKSRRDALALSLQALERVGMHERADNFPRQLSGGQQQRVAVARAIVNAPRLILADEPTGALDRASAIEIISLLASLKRGDRTVVVVTHDSQIASHADRILSFRDGRFEQ